MGLHYRYGARILTKHSATRVLQRKICTLRTPHTLTTPPIPAARHYSLGRRGGDICEFCRGSAFENRRHGAASECRARFELSTSIR